MAEIFITLKEAAELEEVKYKSLAQDISRNKEKYNIQTISSDTGGKDRVLIALSSLSRKARETYRERERLEEACAGGRQGETADKTGVPWYVNTDLEWYMENYRDYYYRAVEIGNTVRKFLDYDEGGRSRHAEQFAREHLGKGARTLYRYTKAYLEAAAWADRLGREDGGSYDFLPVLALCRKPKESGQFPSFTPEVRQAIRNIWFNREFARNQGTREMLYEKLGELAVLNHWGRIPSYQSVARYIAHMMGDGGMYNAWYLASRGEREYKNSRMVKAVRDTTGLQVLQVLQGDEHTFDCWVAYRFPNGRTKAIRPKLVAWVDMRSRAILGDIICMDADSQILKQSLLKVIYTPDGGVPEYLYIDNGKDYTSREMRGKDRNDRSGGWVDMGEGLQFDDAARGFYKSIGIKDDHRAAPYEPWSKAQIERFFRGVCDRFTRWMTSYTGTLTGSRTFAKVDRDADRMLKRGELLDMGEFYTQWSRWLSEKYMDRVHGGLKQAGEQYITPRDLLRHGERYEKAAPPRSYATMLMMKSESVHVYNVGIRKFGHEYRADELCDYIGRKVDIKYDPGDVTTLYVFDKKGRRICEAVSQELLQVGPQVDKEALENHIRAQKRQIRRDRERLEEANRPFEEMNAEYVGFNKATGGIDLMVGRDRKKARVVALPEDRTYRQERGSRKRVPQEEQGEYIARAAEPALKKIRAL